MNSPASDDGQIQEAALRWYTRARAADFSATERMQLESWLAQDPGNRREYARLEQTWNEMDGLRNYFKRTRAVQARRNATRRTAKAALAACCAGIVAIMVFSYPPALYQTPPGRHLSIQIAAGVRAELDADSAIEVNRWSLHPDVRITRGSVYFDVQTPDSGLQVHVAETTLRDSGTRFAITTLPHGGGRVAVAEGIVEISTATGRETLSAGYQTRFGGARVESPTSINPQQVFAWQSGDYFEATTLTEVADTLWRHQRVRIEIPDIRIANLTLSGSYDIRHPQKLLWAIAKTHQLQEQLQPHGHILLTRL